MSSLNKINFLICFIALCSPYQKFQNLGLFMNDVRLEYTISNDLFSNARVNPNLKANSLLVHYGCGYFGSENFAIAPVSCSPEHAQSYITNI